MMNVVSPTVYEKRHRTSGAKLAAGGARTRSAHVAQPLALYCGHQLFIPVPHKLGVVSNGPPIIGLVALGGCTTLSLSALLFGYSHARIALSVLSLIFSLTELCPEAPPLPPVAMTGRLEEQPIESQCQVKQTGSDGLCKVNSKQGDLIFSPILAPRSDQAGAGAVQIYIRRRCSLCPTVLHQLYLDLRAINAMNAMDCNGTRHWTDHNLDHLPGGSFLIYFSL